MQSASSSSGSVSRTNDVLEPYGARVDQDCLHCEQALRDIFGEAQARPAIFGATCLTKGPCVPNIVRSEHSSSRASTSSGYNMHDIMLGCAARGLQQNPPKESYYAHARSRANLSLVLVAEEGKHRHTVGPAILDHSIPSAVIGNRNVHIDSRLVKRAKECGCETLVVARELRQMVEIGLTDHCMAKTAIRNPQIPGRVPAESCWEHTADCW